MDGRYGVVAVIRSAVSEREDVLRPERCPEPIRKAGGAMNRVRFFIFDALIRATTLAGEAGQIPSYPRTEKEGASEQSERQLRAAESPMQRAVRNPHRRQQQPGLRLEGGCSRLWWKYLRKPALEVAELWNV